MSTFDLEPQPISGRLWVKHDVIATGRSERFLNDAHDVEDGGLAVLLLFPDDRIVEHTEVVHVELTVDEDTAAAVNDDLATARQHHRRAGSDDRNTCDNKEHLDDTIGKLCSL